jgi:hypothetical protein
LMTGLLGDSPGGYGMNRASYDLGEPPRFRIPDPIRSGPERRTIYARTAQEVHT